MLSRCVYYISHHYKPGATLAANYESYTPMHLKIPTGVPLLTKVQPCTLINHVAKENISMLLFKAVFLIHHWQLQWGYLSSEKRTSLAWYFDPMQVVCRQLSLYLFLTFLASPGLKPWPAVLNWPKCPLEPFRQRKGMLSKLSSRSFAGSEG